MRISKKDLNYLKKNYWLALLEMREAIVAMKLPPREIKIIQEALDSYAS